MIKRIQRHHYTIDEPTRKNLTPNEIAVYLAIRRLSDFWYKNDCPVDIPTCSLSGWSKVQQRFIPKILDKLEYEYYLIMRASETLQYYNEYAVSDEFYGFYHLKDSDIKVQWRIEMEKRRIERCEQIDKLMIEGGYVD